MIEEDFPQKNKKRAWRRHVNQKMKQKARWIGKHIWGHKGEQLNRDAKLADHLKNCSCDLCTPSRRMNGIPHSEKKRLLED